MSQINVFGAAGGGGGGTLLSLTGNDNVPVTPNGSGTIFDIGNIKSTFPITGTVSSSITSANTSANTLTFSDLNTAIATVTTTGTSPTPIFSLTLSPDSAVMISAQIIAAQSAVGYTAGLFCQFFVGARRALVGGAVIIGEPFDRIFGTDSATSSLLNDTPSVTAAVVGNNINVNVVGESGITYSWTAYVRYVVT